jgi:hypothetical protein
MRDYQIDNLIAVASSFVMLLVVTLLVLRAWRHAADQKHEMRKQLLEKLSTAELARVLETEPGRAWLAGVIGGEHDPAAALAAGAGKGLTLILVGLGLAAAAKVASLPLLGVAALVAAAAGIGVAVTTWFVARGQRRPHGGE